ncbi:acyl-CoA reductase [Segetibacter sp. 3557_3]|uniref:acyl-CoA reductase n=1 Tax=Segetibacter sp. 3557_3 TaxID=2547429 RepID=UPI001058E1A3|nr:acyl-CoA reductase [Segetibacter sp. 3557_3]TDH26505.1 acyl-CoA reductase [Segetibacter sp. 3557_3]
MILQERIDLLVRLGEYLSENDESWVRTKAKAYSKNPWFIPEFIDHAAANIKEQFLQRAQLEHWATSYGLNAQVVPPKRVGLVMAGNIPMVGFHDMLCIFITGHEQLIKLSSKDEVLIPFLLNKLNEFDPAVSNYINVSEKLNGCEVYIATGGNNTGRYFEYYFGKYPNIIRKNRTSVAVLTGEESVEQLEALADDIQLYFGLGCRNVTKLYVPDHYNFEPLLQALRKYDHFMEFHKYRHNYDYQLALLMMGNKFYMTNDSILFSENKSLFSAVSQVHFEYYSDKNALTTSLGSNTDLQCIIGNDFVPFGHGQKPRLADYADGVDTMKFLLSLDPEMAGKA